MFITTANRRKSNIAIEQYKSVVEKTNNIFASKVIEASKPAPRLEKIIKSSPLAYVSGQSSFLLA